jgi:hypothetical protein
MIGHATGGDESARMVAQDSANVFKEARLYCRIYPGLSVFGAEDNMAVE